MLRHDEVVLLRSIIVSHAEETIVLSAHHLDSSAPFYLPIFCMQIATWMQHSSAAFFLTTLVDVVNVFVNLFIRNSPSSAVKVKGGLPWWNYDPPSPPFTQPRESLIRRGVDGV